MEIKFRGVLDGILKQDPGQAGASVLESRHSSHTGYLVKFKIQIWKPAISKDVIKSPEYMRSTMMLLLAKIER